MIETIVFDMDGVIFDTERLGLECWELLADKYGLVGIRPVAMKCIGRNTEATTRIILDHYGEDLDIQGLYNESKTVMKQLMEKNGGIPLKSGAKELLRVLKDRGSHIALASSTKTAIVKAELAEAGLLDCFEVIVGGDMVKNSKPDPEIYLKACDELGADPKKTYAVEDSRNGIISASEAGLMPILVPDLIEPDEEMLKRAVMRLSSLDELLEKLDNTDTGSVKI